MKNASVSAVVADADSPAMYEPEGFDREKELTRATALAKTIESALRFRAVVDDPGGFQDGSIFTKIMLFAENGGMPGQLLISSFGSLVAAYGVEDQTTAEEVAKLATTSGYVVVDLSDLGGVYVGKNEQLGGMTWAQRFFSEFYVFGNSF